MMIEIEPIRYGSKVEIRWQFPLGERSEPSRQLAEALDTITGVEAVDVRRYSATLKVAGHLQQANVFTVARAVAEIMHDLFVTNGIPAVAILAGE